MPALERRRHGLGGLERRGFAGAAAGKEHAHLGSAHFAAQAQVLRAQVRRHGTDVGQLSLPPIRMRGDEEGRGADRGRQRKRTRPARIGERGTGRHAQARELEHPVAQQPRDEAMRDEARDHDAHHGEHAQLRESRETGERQRQRARHRGEHRQHERAPDAARGGARGLAGLRNNPVLQPDTVSALLAAVPTATVARSADAATPDPELEPQGFRSRT